MILESRGQMPSSQRVMNEGNADRKMRFALLVELLCISVRRAMNFLRDRLRRGIAAGLMPALALSLTACVGSSQATVTHVVVPPRVELLSGGSKSLNYTPWYIHTWELSGPPGMRVGGGGPNVMPVRSDGNPSGGGAEICCTSYPVDWQPGLRLTVRWLVFKDVKRLGAKAPGDWYKAEDVRIPQYDGHHAGDIWAVFLPGDRVRIMVPDGIDPNGGNNPDIRPPDNDPYIVHGVRDDEWNELFPNGVARGIKQ
jgi:hypothetical protein